VAVDDESVGTNVRWSVATASIVTAVFALSNAPTPLYVRWQDEWGFSSGTLTVIFAAYIAGLVGTLLVAGRIADRHGRRVVLVPGALLAVVSSVAFLAAQNVVWLLVARLLAGIAVGAAVTAGMAAVVDLAPARSRHRASLLASSAMVFGAGLGPLVAGLLAQSHDRPHATVFTITSVITVTALVLAALLPLTRPAPTPRRPWRLPSPPAENRRDVAWGVATCAPGITATSFVLSLGPSVLREAIDTDNSFVAGAIACTMFLAATGIQFALARLTTRTHLLLSSVAAVSSMALLGLAVTARPSATVFAASAVLAGVAQGLGQLAGLTLIATRVPENRRAESNAALNIAGYVPAAALPIATGYAADALGLPSAVLTFAGIVGVIAATALVAVRAQTSAHATMPTATTRTTGEPDVSSSR
jgi:MFS family permease